MRQPATRTPPRPKNSCVSQRLIGSAWAILAFIGLLCLSLFFRVVLFPSPESRSGFTPAGQNLLIKLNHRAEVIEVTVAAEHSFNAGKSMALLNRDPHVAYIEPNALYQAATIPNDTFFSFQEYLQQIQAPEAWNFTAGSQDVVVAVLDTGVDIDNPDLRDSLWTNDGEIPGNKLDDDHNGYIDDIHGWNFIEQMADVSPFRSEYTDLGLHHGTIVAGIIAARGNNSVGIAGISWRSRIMPIRVLASNGEGTALSVARGIDYAAAAGADIINLSFVGKDYSVTLANAIERAARAGVIIVAAAGNDVLDGSNLDAEPRYPVCIDGPAHENWVIGVAAVDKNDRKASFSDYGTRCIDIAAPGVGIFSTLYHDPTNPEFSIAYGGFWSGTSVATPQVAGTLALMKSVNSTSIHGALANVLKLQSDPIDSLNQPWQGSLGAGRLNTYHAVLGAYGILPSENPATPSLPILARIYAVPLTQGSDNRAVPFVNAKTEWRREKPLAFSAPSMASLNLINDAELEYISGARPGEKPMVTIRSAHGAILGQWYAYAPSFTGGVEIAAGDIDGDHLPEIVTAPMGNGGPHIRVFSPDGVLKYQWFAFNPAERGGLALAISDVNRDSLNELIVGSRLSAAPLVRIFNARGVQLGQILAYHPDFRGGVFVAAGDLDHDGFAEIITAPGSGGGPHIKVFDWKGTLESEWFAYHKNFRGGVTVAIAHVSGDEGLDIITAPGNGGGPHIRIFDSHGNVQSQFFAFDSSYRGGIRIAADYVHEIP